MGFIDGCRQRVVIHSIEEKRATLPEQWLFSLAAAQVYLNHQVELYSILADTLFQVTFWIITVIAENVLASDDHLTATDGYSLLFAVAGVVPALNAGFLVFFVLYKTTEKVYE